MTPPPAPQLPFTVEAGDAAVQLLLLRLRRAGWVLVLLVLAGGVVAIVDRDPAGGWYAWSLVAVVLVVLLGVLGHRRSYRHATITVTSTELVVVHRRRRVLARGDVREVVVGCFTVQRGRDTSQAAFVDHTGRRRITLVREFWPTGRSTRSPPPSTCRCVTRRRRTGTWCRSATATST